MPLRKSSKTERMKIVTKNTTRGDEGLIYRLCDRCSARFGAARSHKLW